MPYWVAMKHDFCNVSDCILCAQREYFLPPQYTFRHYQALDSSNAYLKRCIRASQLQRETVVVVEQQSGGYGRRGRSWHSDHKSSITFSLALSTKADPLLSMVAGLALAQSLRHFGVTAWLKWPNDIYCFDKLQTPYKLAGILVEAVSSWVVIGIGINATPNELSSATSLLQQKPTANVSTLKIDFLKIFLPQLVTSINHYHRFGFDALGWQKLHGWQNKYVTIKNSTIKGRAVGVDVNGYFLVEDENKKLIRLCVSDYDQENMCFTFLK